MFRIDVKCMNIFTLKAEICPVLEKDLRGRDQPQLRHLQEGVTDPLPVERRLGMSLQKFIQRQKLVTISGQEAANKQKRKCEVHQEYVSPLHMCWSRHRAFLFLPIIRWLLAVSDWDHYCLHNGFFS